MPAEWEPHDFVWLGWEDDFLAYQPVAVDTFLMIAFLRWHQETIFDHHPAQAYG
jgi:hypothetical protein